MLRDLLSDCGLISIEVQRCVRTLGRDRPDVVCISHVDFENEDGLTRALGIHASELMADFPNYTNIDPEIHVREVLASGV